MFKTKGRIGTKTVALALAVLSALVVISMVCVPARATSPTALKGPRMDTLVLKFYSGQGSMFIGYMSPEPETVDFVAWYLTKPQYDSLVNQPEHQFVITDDLGYYEIGINNNETLLNYPTNYISPTNYTEFRQAMAFCMDKEWLITSVLEGFGVRIDTPMARYHYEKLDPRWVEFKRSRWGVLGSTDLGNYPYEYDPYAAAALFDEAGFVQGTTLNPYYDSELGWSSQYLRVYPAKQTLYEWQVFHVPDEVEALPGDTYRIELAYPIFGEWTNQKNLRIYYTPNKAETVILRDITDYSYDTVTKKITITNGNGAAWPPPSPSSVFTVKYAKSQRDNPRAGQTLDTLIAYARSDHNPRLQAGISLTAHLKKLGIPVTLTEGSSGVCSTPVYAYRNFHFYTAGWSLDRYPVGFVNFFTPTCYYEWGNNYLGVLNPAITYWAELQRYYNPDIETSIYAGQVCQMLVVDEACCIALYSNRNHYPYKAGWLGVASTAGYGTGRLWDWMFLNMYHENPAVNTVRYGLMQPPLQLNPMFSTWLWDFEVLDLIFTGDALSYLIANPNKPSTAGKSPAGADQAWFAKDWKHEWIDANSNGIRDKGDQSKLTFWLRNDIYWHGNATLAPWLLSLDDIEYAHWTMKSYTDCNQVDDLINLLAINKYPAENKIEFIYDGPSTWSLYSPVIPLPKKVYEVIPDHSGDTVGSLSVEDTLIGTGMWKLRPNTYTPGAGGGIIVDANRDFFLEPLLGDIDFAYFWNAGTPPQGGSFKIGLADLVTLAKAYGSKGNCDPAAGGSASPNWNPACDLAKPACVIGLADLVTLAKVYGQTWGTYT